MLLRTAALSVASLAQAADSLPAFLADPDQTSVSGLSSGAFMAVQYQVAFSSTVKGVGVVAGGPYYCAGGLGYGAAAICMGMGMVPFMHPNPSLMLLAAEAFASAGQINPLADLKNDRIYVLSGTRDRVVYPQAVDATVEFFKLAGVPSTNISYINQLPAGHALITRAFGNDCAANDPPYINHCTVKGQGYDQTGALLTLIYGKLNPPLKSARGRIVTFNQREFAAASGGMADNGYVYVPKACGQDSNCCKVHIALHG